MEKDLLGWLCRQFSLLSDDLSFQHSCAFKPRSLTQVEASAAINTLRREAKARCVTFSMSYPSMSYPSHLMQAIRLLIFLSFQKTLILIERVSTNLDASLTGSFCIHLICMNLA